MFDSKISENFIQKIGGGMICMEKILQQNQNKNKTKIKQNQNEIDTDAAAAGAAASAAAIAATTANAVVPKQWQQQKHLRLNPKILGP